MNRFGFWLLAAIPHACFAAFAQDAPEITGVNKDNMGPAQSWFLQQQVRVSVAGGEARVRNGGKKPETKTIHRRLPR